MEVLYTEGDSPTKEGEFAYLKGEGRGLGVEPGEGGARRVALEQPGAEALRVALRDEAALWDGRRTEPFSFQLSLLPLKDIAAAAAAKCIKAERLPPPRAW